MLKALSPSIAGSFTKTPLGFILHGSRSGRVWSERKEFDATVRFARSGANGLGWNATVMSGRVTEHIDPRRWGWNAREFSRQYIAVEFAQARLGDAISDEAVDAFCWYALNVVREAWLDIPLFCINHSQTPPGIRDGKTDCFPIGPEAETFADRVTTRLQSLRRS